MTQQAQRILVIGTSCSGKTSFARALSQTLNCPHIELDALHWGPNWTPRPADEFRALTEQAASQERWVSDGNVLGRALSRTFKRVVTREELYSGNRETLRMALFDRESILWWVISTFHRRRREYHRLFDQKPFAQITYIELKEPADARRFLIAD